MKDDRPTGTPMIDRHTCMTPGCGDPVAADAEYCDRCAMLGLIRKLTARVAELEAEAERYNHK